MTETNVIENLPPNFSYKIESQINDVIIILVKELTDKISALEWLKKYSDISKTTWRKARTYPKTGKYNVFKTDLRCHHGSNKNVKGLRASRHTGCQARLQIIVKRFKTNLKSKPEKYGGLITFKKKHNHSLSVPAVLKFRDVSHKVKDKMCDLFHIGHSPSSALITHKFDLMLDFKSNYHEIATDGKYMPTVSMLAKLYHREYSIECGNQDKVEMFRSLEALVYEYNQNSNGKAVLKQENGNCFVVICTPIMLRVHKTVSQSSELMMIDATAGFNKQRHRVYCLFTPCSSGMLPLCIVITHKEKESVLSDALFCLKELLQEDAFFGQNMPQVIITDDDLKEINALEKAFPDSVKLMYQFHVLKTVWLWISNLKHGINKNHILKTYLLFKKIMYSTTEIDAIQNYLYLREFALGQNNSDLVAFIDDLWSFNKFWADCFRQMPPVNESDTKNYTEVLFRMIQDCIFDIIKGFNLTQLFHFITTRYEKYLNQRLTEFYSGKDHNSLLKNFMPFIYEEAQYLIELDRSVHVFNVKDELGNTFIVDLILKMCTCQLETTRKLCKHSSAAILSLEGDILSYFLTCTTETKNNLNYITESYKPLESNGTSITDLYLSEEPTFDSESIDEQFNLLEEENSELKKLFSDIQNSLKKEPKLFVPAVRKMLNSVRQYASTEAGLLHILQSFELNNESQMIL